LRYLRDALAYFLELWFPAAIAAIRAAKQTRETEFPRLALEWTAYRVPAAGENVFGLLQLIYKPRQGKKPVSRKTFPHCLTPLPAPHAQTRARGESGFTPLRVQGTRQNKTKPLTAHHS